jgi:hypothetical protein
LRTNGFFIRAGAAVLALGFACANPVLAMHIAPKHPDVARAKTPPRVLSTEKLADGSTAQIYANGLAMIVGKNQSSFN